MQQIKINLTKKNHLHVARIKLRKRNYVQLTIVKLRGMNHTKFCGVKCLNVLIIIELNL